MKNNFLNELKFYLWRRRIRRFFRPTWKPQEKFVHNSKLIFLQSFEQKFPAATLPPYASHHIWRYSFVFLGIFLFANTGAMVIADQKNVGADSPLYIFKRANEQIRLRLASSEKTPDLHAEFAQRRLDEIQAVQESHETPTEKTAKVQKLDKDFHSDLDNSIANAKADTSTDIEATDNVPANKKKNDNKSKELCQKADQLIHEHGRIVSDNSGSESSDFQKHCNKSADGPNKIKTKSEND